MVDCAYALAIRFALITGCRRNEACYLVTRYQRKVNELDLVQNESLNLRCASDVTVYPCEEETSINMAGCLIK